MTGFERLGEGQNWPSLRRNAVSEGAAFGRRRIGGGSKGVGAEAFGAGNALGGGAGLGVVRQTAQGREGRKVEPAGAARWVERGPTGERQEIAGKRGCGGKEAGMGAGGILKQGKVTQHALDDDRCVAVMRVGWGVLAGIEHLPQIGMGGI